MKIKKIKDAMRDGFAGLEGMTYAGSGVWIRPDGETPKWT